MQKGEIIDAVLMELRKNPKVTNLQLALKLKLHRNTISKYRKLIRTTYYKTPQEIVNKIDSKLDDEFETMSHHELLSYRGQLVPKKTEVEATYREIKLSWNIGDDTSAKDKVSASQRAAKLSRSQSEV